MGRRVGTEAQRVGDDVGYKPVRLRFHCGRADCRAPREVVQRQAGIRAPRDEPVPINE
jgi:hypothetical protein